MPHPSPTGAPNAPAAVAATVLLIVVVPMVGSAREPDAKSTLEDIVVTATRTVALIGDQPLHVEAVPAEEIEENLTVQPGNLSSLLNELPGVRLQASAPGLGAAGLSLRGMPARHTLVLTDGLPLLGTEAATFGLLQTPPLDLERVEVVKGAVSALYGSSALGGVLNLVSRAPTSEPGVLANVSSRGARDLVGFFTTVGNSRWSGTLTGGAHEQVREDVDGDGWSDIAGYRRFTLRPRLWWQDGTGDSTFVTAGIVDEQRTGGTLPGRILPSGAGFPESLQTRRLDTGIVSQWSLAGGQALTTRASATSTHLDQTSGPIRSRSAESTALAEEAWNGTDRGHQWLLGIAFEHDQLTAPDVAGIGYTYNVPALFMQDTFSPVPWLVAAGSIRTDVHNVYGTFVSPRFSALFRRPESSWSLRASVGAGFAAPTPFVDETEAVGLGALRPLHGLHAERATTESLDAKWSAHGWDVNASVFNTEIRDPLIALRASTSTLELVNAPGARRAPGAEALVGYVVGPWHAIASWTRLEVTESDSFGVRQPTPLVPREAAEIGAILESEKRGRIGLEIGYTGRAALANDPYRRVSPAYVELNALGELRLGGFSIFFNAINLTNVRQTHFDPLLRPSPGPGGNPITDVWAPLDGRTFNLGIRAEL